MIFIHLLVAYASELYKFNYSVLTGSRVPINSIEDNYKVAKFYESNQSNRKIFFHQGCPYIIQKLCKIGEIVIGKYVIKPFKSIHCRENNICIGKYKKCFKYRGIYGQEYGKIKVRFVGGTENLLLKEIGKNEMELSGNIFLEVVEKLIDIDYTISFKNSRLSIQKP